MTKRGKRQSPPAGNFRRKLHHGDTAKRTEEAQASSNILAHSYSPETGQLTITYRGGRRYAYDEVPQELADGLEKADSKGRFIHANIIDKFPVKKLPLDD